jgi:CHAT domain-containing protein
MAHGEIETAPAPGRSLTPESSLLLLTASLLVLAGAYGSIKDRSLSASAAKTLSASAAETLPAIAPAAIAQASACENDLRELRHELRRLRAGEALFDTELSALRSRADHLGSHCERPDAARATRHLLALAPEDALSASAAMDRVQATLDAMGADASAHIDEQLSTALRALESLLPDLDALRDPLPAAYARRILADLHLRDETGAGAQTAIALSQRALATYHECGFLDQEVEALDILARAHLAESALSVARSTALRGLEMARTIDDALYESLSLRTLVRIADRTGTGLERERLLRVWAELAQDHERCALEEWWAWTRETVTWLIDEDHPTQAHTFLENALANRRDATDRDPLASTTLRRQARVLRATILIRNGEHERASALLAEGATYSDRTRLLRAYLNLQRLRDADAIESPALKAELAVLLKESWTSNLPPDLQAQGAVYSAEHHLQSERPELARALLEATVRRAIRQDRGLATRTSLDETVSLGGEVLGLHAIQLLARAYLDLDHPILAATLIEELQARSLRAGQAALTPTDLNAWASHYDHGLVTWVLGPDEGVAIWLGPDGQTDSLRIPFGRRPVQRAAASLRQALRERRHEDATQIGAELCSALLPELLLRRLTKSRAPAGLLLLAHGPLESLPLAALRLPTPAGTDHAGPLLAEATTLHILPGLPAAQPSAALRTSDPWILAGAPTDARGETRLPEAREELLQISHRRENKLILGPDMTRAAMIEALENSANLHIATHIEWVDTPAGPAPALELAAGEFLTVADLPGRLGARELVVLSGCESAGGQVLDGEGVLGFVRAFLESGTRGVVATLWPVEDAAAREFGIALHEGLVAGSEPAAAVRGAGRRLRELDRADWAAFQWIGQR